MEKKLLVGGRRCRYVKKAYQGWDPVYVPITLYSDKTDIPNKQSAHPIMIGLANLPAHLVAKAEHQLFIPIGYFSILKQTDMRHIPALLHSTFQRGVLHKSFAVIFGESWQKARNSGIPVALPSGRKVLLFPDFLYALCDLPEAALYRSTRGCRGKCPCPNCTIPTEKSVSGDLMVHRDARLQAPVTQSMSKGDQENAGCYDSHNAFNMLVRNIHNCIASDDLHQVHLGAGAMCKVWFSALHGHARRKFLELTGVNMTPRHTGSHFAVWF